MPVAYTIKGRHGASSGTQTMGTTTPSLYVVGPPGSGGSKVQGLYIRESYVAGTSATYRWIEDQQLDASAMTPTTFNGTGS